MRLHRAMLSAVLATCALSACVVEVPPPTPSAVPTPAPTSSPSPAPTPVVVPVPAPDAAPEPTPTPTAIPTPEPTASPPVEPAPVATPSPEPTPAATPEPIPVATPTPVETPEPAPLPAPTPAPVPFPTSDLPVTPTPAPAPDALTLPDAIPSNFDTAAMIVPSWGSGAIAPSGAPDPVGAFRFLCAPSHEAYDDPIVYPGQPGKSHLHEFFGNTLTSAFSTYQTLRETGDSTCNNPLNRSAYWIPAMLDGQGHVVRPDFVSTYYKRRPESDPYCFVEAPKGCIAMPRGLRFIFGYNMSAGKPGPVQGDFICANMTTGTDAGSGHPTLTEASLDCPAAARQIGARIFAPECWDGVHLDSADHRSHMAYPGYGSWGYLRCPDNYPYVVPTLTLGIWYSLDDSFTRDGKPSYHLSSDEMGTAIMTPGSTLHADWFGAWDDATMARWMGACINKQLNCSGGDLGDGGQLRDMGVRASPRLVPVPARP